MKKRFVIACLVISLLTGMLSSCNNAEDETIDTSVPETVVEETEKSKGGNLPNDIDFNGESISITFQGDKGFVYKHDVLFDAELTGDVVNDAIYTRNITTETDLNVKLNWIEGNPGMDDFSNEVKAAILADEVPAELAMFDVTKCINMVIENVFHEVSTLPYIDYNDPYWHNSMMQNLQINGKNYMLTGGHSLGTMVNANVTIFNKELYTDIFGDVNELYDLVEDNKWTLEKLNEYSRATYIDLNGNSVRDSEDTFGCVTVGGTATSLTRTIGLNYEKTDDAGNLVIDIYNDQILKMVDQLYELFWSGEVSHHDAWNYDMKNHFAEGRSLFFINSLEGFASQELRSMDVSYGVVPSPVLEEGMEYFSHTSPIVTVIPVTVSTDRFEIVGAVLEKLAYEGYEQVIPAWYDIAMKNKLADDERDADMIDLIYKALNTTKFCAVFPAYFYYTVEDKINSSNYTSYYESQRASMEQQWNAMFNK